MDPDEILKELLSLARSTLDRCDRGYVNDSEESVELSNKILDLHEWISKGGFLPTAWRTD